MTTHVRFSGALDLLEWKHRIFDLYRDVRGAADPRAAWLHWRETRNRLYRDHPQSPLLPERRRQFGGCDFYDYDPAWRVTATAVDAERSLRELAASSGGTFELGFDREHRTVVLDFNFAYNPSCSYNPAWSCPLAPAANRLPLAVEAGERTSPPTTATPSPGRADGSA